MAVSIFIVRVPEAEPYVAQLRERFDPAARRGLGAHITVLYPFMPPDRVDQTVLGRVQAVASTLAPFAFQLTRVARFPGTLYLAAHPAAPFVALNARLRNEFPVSPRHRGKSRSLVPHLSVVRKSDVDDRAAEAGLALVLETHGPIACMCRQVELIEDSSGLWRPMQGFALSAARR